MNLIRRLRLTEAQVPNPLLESGPGTRQPYLAFEVTTQAQDIDQPEIASH